MESSALIDALKPFFARLYRGQMVHYLHVAGLSLFTYDHFTTTFDEIALIWPAKWGAGKILFLLARYIAWPELFMTIYVELFSKDSNVCRGVYVYSVWSTVLGITVSDMILVLRTWAIWGARRSVLVFLAGLLFSVTAVNCYFVAYYTKHTVLISANTVVSGAAGCFIVSSTRQIGFAWIGTTAFEFVIVILTVVKGIEHFKRVPSNLIASLYRDGILYFIYLFSISLTHLVFVYAAPPEYIVLLAEMQRAFHTILSCRIILHLRAASHGGTALSETGTGTVGPHAVGNRVPLPIVRLGPRWAAGDLPDSYGVHDEEVSEWFGDKPWQANSTSTATEMSLIARECSA